MKGLSSQNRGQLNTLGPSVLLLVIAGIFLILGIVMLAEIRDTDTVRLSNYQTINNETLSCNGLTAPNCTAGDNATVSNAGDFTAFAVLEIYAANHSNGWIRIPSTNYTTNGSGSILLANFGGVDNCATCIQNGTWNATYSFNSGGESYKAANTTLVGIGNFSDFWEIIVIAVILSVILGVILVAFARRRVR